MDKWKLNVSYNTFWKSGFEYAKYGSTDMQKLFSNIGLRQSNYRWSGIQKSIFSTPFFPKNTVPLLLYVALSLNYYFESKWLTERRTIAKETLKSHSLSAHESKQDEGQEKSNQKS